MCRIHLPQAEWAPTPARTRSRWTRSYPCMEDSSPSTSRRSVVPWTSFVGPLGPLREATFAVIQSHCLVIRMQ